MSYRGSLSDEEVPSAPYITAGPSIPSRYLTVRVSWRLDKALQFLVGRSVDVYLDTNAVGYFDDHPSWSPTVLARARERLRELVRSKSMRVLVSYALLEELLGILPFVPEKYARVMAFLWEVADCNLLIEDELGRNEVRKGGRLEGNERLELWVKAVSVRHECLHPRALAGIPRRTQTDFTQFQLEESQRRDRVRQKLGTATSDQSRRTLLRWWHEGPVDDWVRDFMQTDRQQLGLSDNSSEWPEPRRLESIWRFYAYKMARICLNVGENRRVRGTDLYDAHHYVAASYTDVMVTDDGDLRATCAIIPRQPFSLETFEEFVVNRLGVQYEARNEDR